MNSGDYYQYNDTLIPGQTARAEDVSAELDGIEAGLKLLPKPLEDGSGFAEPFVVADATQANHAASWGQLQVMQQNAAASAAAAATSEGNVATMETNVEGLEANVVTLHGEVVTLHGETEANRDLSLQWATSLTEVSGGLYGARYYAQIAQAAASASRTWVGYWDASGNTFPITPQAGDEGKFWIITAAGTLTGVGTVNVGDELAINNSLAWEKVGLSTVYLLASDNLAGLSSKATARTNLGLGTAAELNFGTGANQVVRRDGSANIPGNVTGTAAYLATARSITLDGDVSSPAVNFDGQSNITITVTVGDDSHGHTLSTISDAGTAAARNTGTGPDDLPDNDNVDAKLADYQLKADLAASISDGSFDPASATLVWSGSAGTGVDMTGLSESGPGWYVLENAAGFQFPIYVQSQSKIAFGGMQGSVFNNTNATFTYSRLSSGKLAILYADQSSGNWASGFITVTAIYKV